MLKIKLGQKVRDKLSGTEGVAVSRTEWLNGCVRIQIQPEGTKDGVPFDTFVIDEPQLEVVGSLPVHKKTAPSPEPSHGDRADPGRANDPV